MKPGESVEDFASHFLHLCYEIPKQFLDLDFMSQELKRLVHVSRHGEPPNFPSSSTLSNHEAPQFAEEEPNTPFVPCTPPFAVPKWIPPCRDCKVEKFVQRVSPHSSRKAEKFVQRVTPCRGHKAKKYARDFPSPSSQQSPTPME